MVHLRIGLCACVLIAICSIPLRAQPPQPSAPAAAPTIQPTLYRTICIGSGIGTDMPSVDFEKQLGDAANLGATHVVLLIDSPQNDPHAALRVARILRNHRQLQTTAFVRQADAPAMALAMACDHVYVHPAATLTIPADVLPVQYSDLTATSPNLTKHLGKLVSLMESKPKDQPLELNAATIMKEQLADAQCSAMGDVRQQLGLTSWERAADPVVVDGTPPVQGGLTVANGPGGEEISVNTYRSGNSSSGNTSGGYYSSARESSRQSAASIERDYQYRKDMAERAYARQGIGEQTAWQRRALDSEVDYLKRRRDAAMQRTEDYSRQQKDAEDNARKQARGD